MNRVSFVALWLSAIGGGHYVTANAMEPWELPPRLMQFRFSGLASGTLGDIDFTDAVIDITASAETSQIERRLILGTFQSLWVENQRASIHIEGVGEAVFTQITETWTRERLVGFARDFETFISRGTDLVTVDVQSQTPSYNLYDELPPFAVDGFFVIGGQFIDIQTSLGLLTLQSGSLQSGMFSATIVPEPTSIVIPAIVLLLTRPKVHHRTRSGTPR
jgi:hypothetical protein